MGTFASPVDLPGKFALAAGIACAVLAVSRRARENLSEALGLVAGPELRTRRVLVLSFVSAFASLAYVAYYLEGAPKIVDATTYWFQGKAFASGHVTVPVEAPSASFRGRFSLFVPPDRLAGIFPPGYPLLLSGAFILGAPLVLGPLLAAAITASTYLLGWETAHASVARKIPRARERESVADAVATTAAAVSIVSAALRYHTADTMSHGATALFVTLAWALTLRALRLGKMADAWSAGLAIGMVVATRPVSSFAIGLVVVVALVSGTLAFPTAPGTSPSIGRAKRVAAFVFGTVPGVLLLAGVARTVTGSATTLPQTAYYAASDGPPGCFRYGFGDGVGCMFEHGEFVRSRLTEGYGFFQALGVTARRLRYHAEDVANFEPLALVTLVPLLPRFRVAHVRPVVGATLAIVALHVLAYAPFYFDGDYPGGGARFYADVLPLGHVLVGLALHLLVPSADLLTKATAFLSAATVGFAFHGSHDHAALKARDGGRPMWQPELLEQAHVANGIVFVDTDHAFAIAHKPGVDPTKGILVARLRNDDRDKMLVDAHPGVPSWRYVFGETSSTVGSFVPRPMLPNGYRFEGEAEWPPLAQSGGWVEPEWLSPNCATGGRALALRTTGVGATGVVVLALPVPKSGPVKVVPTVVRGAGSGRGSLVLVSHGGTIATRPDVERLAALPAIAEWTWDVTAPGSPASCTTLDARDVKVLAGEALLLFRATAADPGADARTPHAVSSGDEGRGPTPPRPFAAALDRVDLLNP
ncbi:MAG: hypothetical protein U0169_03795 [Polyangiaceae bacterium]